MEQREQIIAALQGIVTDLSQQADGHHGCKAPAESESGILLDRTVRR